MNEHCKELELRYEVFQHTNMDEEDSSSVANGTTHVSNVALTNVVFNLTADRRYRVLFSLANNSGEEITWISTNISTFDVQRAENLTTNGTAVCLTLYFAEGSTANGLVELVHEESGKTYQELLEKLPPLLTAYGCVSNVLDQGWFQVYVYDDQNGTRSEEPAIFLGHIHLVHSVAPSMTKPMPSGRHGMCFHV